MNWKAWTDLRRESADQEVGLGEEVDVKNDSSKRVLGVAVVEAGRPRDGVIANELIVWVPESDMHTETQINTSNTH